MSLRAVLVLICVHYFRCARCSTSSECDREGSRDAARIIEGTLVPLVQSKAYVLPPACPLHPSLSLFHKQEGQKKYVRKGVWQCEFDKKIFRSESFIDKHMQNKHAHEREPNSTVCLANLCDVLQCKFFQAFKKDALFALSHLPCHPASMEKIKLECQDLAHVCFPPHQGRAAEELHAYFVRHFCSASQCNWRMREELLKPLAHDKHGQAVLWMLMVWGVLALLLLGYGLILCHWSSRTPSNSNSLLRAIGWRGRKAEKLY